MRTIKLTISYDGTNYVGWQRQPNGVSIQERIESALAKMTGKQTPVIAAGRTDAGVHALAQVAHFTTKSKISCEKFLASLNSMLPDDISILSAEDVDSSFNARRSAKGKIYRYSILHSDLRAPLLTKRCWHVRGRLDLAAMKRAARAFIGEHDFASFRASGCSSAHAKRCIKKIKITKKRGIIDIEFSGNGFVRHMVRNMVGTLVDVGKGKIKATDMKAILSARKRQKAGRCAPAHGLYLVKVDY